MCASFGDEGIQKVLLLGYRFCSWFSGNVGRRWYQWVPLQSSIWRPSPCRFPRTEEDNVVSISFNPPNNDTTNLSATSGFIFPNINNNRDGSNLAIRLTQNPIPISFLVHPDWKMEMRKWEGQMCLGTTDNRAQRISNHNWCLTLVIAMATMSWPRYHRQQSHSVGGTTHSEEYSTTGVGYARDCQRRGINSTYCQCHQWLCTILSSWRDHWRSTYLRNYTLRWTRCRMMPVHRWWFVMFRSPRIIIIP